MTQQPASGALALLALLNARSDFAKVGEKDWSAAAGLIVKKLLISAGQTVESIAALKAAVGDDIFETQLKSLTAHQARLLARRLDKTVPDLEVSTAGAAAAWVRDLLDKHARPAPAPTEETAPEAPAEASETETASAAEDKKPDAWSSGGFGLGLSDEADTPAEDIRDPDPSPPPPSSGSAYFGRKSFRS